ncbi:MAG: glycerol-3-phosphate dehydrogenase/oxidase [Pirellulales bacterium]|nr:glycerol-3-phosphate dehydrogenase/oxidase [Pirellulales bacterium]
MLDLLVVGGGIVGAGVARDAAMRGLRVGLIEQRDFAFGTSSRSSHLLHGGLRYLSQGHLRLVHEASKEKRVIHRIAPHLAAPQAFIFPTRRGWRWARWKLGIGVKLYDLLCGRRNLGKSSTLTRRETLELLPGLSPDGVTGAVRYFDGLTHDSRLVMDTLRSASRHGAIVLNYARFLDAARQTDHWRIDARDAAADRAMAIRARQIVNATGPWSDKLPHSRTRLRLTKGVHLVIDRGRLPIPEAVVLTEGARILFAIPWGQRVILGTTDTDYAGPVDDPPCEPDDVQYVLDVVAALFPGAGIAPRDVISTWSGLRPLVADRNGQPSDISRRHEITLAEPGWWDVTGGKLTTYRLMAEQTVDRVIRALGRPANPCRTAVEPLLDPREDVGPSSIVPPPVTREAVEHYCHNEWALRLDDVLIRRTGWWYYHADVQAVADAVAPWMAKSLGWDAPRVAAERAACFPLWEAASPSIPPPHRPTAPAKSPGRIPAN